jgi:hypothetical protein
MAPPRNPANEALSADVLERLCKVFLILSSPNDGDKLAAMHALDRALEANGVDYHVLVARMKKSWLSDSDKALFQIKLKEAEEVGRRKVDISRVSSDFSSTDGSDDWRQIALYIDAEKNRLPPRDYNDWARGFIDDMATRARHDLSYRASPKQFVQLRKFFVRLGGRM